MIDNYNENHWQKRYFSELEEKKKTFSENSKLRSKLEETVDINNEIINENDKLKDMNKTLNDEIERIRDESEKLRKDNEKLKKELDLMNIRLGKDSTNSNWSSSHDQPWLSAKRRIYSSRTKSECQVGGQIGHKGHFGRLCVNPDQIINHLNEIPKGNGFIDKEHNIVIKQIKEIEFRTKIVQHNYTFNDGTEVINLPLLPNAYSYGESINSFCIWLMNQGYVSLNRTTQFIKELTNNEINISDAYLSSLQLTYAKHLQPVVEEIKENIRKNKVIHFDETSIGINGKHATIQGYADDKNTYLLVTNKKCDDQFLNFFNGLKCCVIMDFCKGYQKIPSDKAQCNVHIERYLRLLINDYKILEAQTMMDLLHEMKDKKEKLIKTKIFSLASSEYTKYQKRFLDICDKFLKWYQVQNDNEQFYFKAGLLLFRRMKEHIDQHLAFIKDFDIPYSNNLIERDFRNTKTKMKISGCFRNIDYAIAFANIRSFIQTCIKRKINTWFAIQKSLSNNYSFGE